MSIRFTQKPEEASLVVHAGSFHADEIFVMVVLEKLYGNLVVYRVPCNQFDEEKGRFSPQAIVADVGYGEFDHHQSTKVYHSKPKNYEDALPIPYAAFGLIWKKYGYQLCLKIANDNQHLASFLWNKIERELVLAIDAADNGIYHVIPQQYEYFPVVTISQAIAYMNPNAFEETSEEACINSAIFLAKITFNNLIKRGLFEFHHPSSAGKDFKNPYASSWEVHEVFSMAVLKAIFPDYPDLNVKVYGNDLEYLSHPLKYSASVGKKEKIPTSSLGIIWKNYGKNFCNQIRNDPNLPDFLWYYINNELVYGIDADANQIRPIIKVPYVPYPLLLLTDVIQELLTSPAINSPNVLKKSENTAVKIAYTVFYRILMKGLAWMLSREQVEEKISSSYNHILIFDQSVHWEKWLLQSRNPKAKEIFFAIYPSSQGGYVVKPVRSSQISTDLSYRKPFPKEWCGLNGKELQEITGVSNATFVHSKGFIGGAMDKKGAIQLAKKAMSYYPVHTQN